MVDPHNKVIVLLVVILKAFILVTNLASNQVANLAFDRTIIDNLHIKEDLQVVAAEVVVVRIHPS